MQLAMLRSTIQRNITWSLMPAHTSSCHTLGIKILITTMFNSYKFKDNSLRLRVNKLKHKDPKSRPQDNRDRKPLAWMLMNSPIV